MRHTCTADDCSPPIRSRNRLTYRSKTSAPAGTAIFILVAIALTLLMAGILTRPGPAEADSPQIAQLWVHGSEVSTSAIPEFSPKEIVEIKVPANSVLQPVQEANILMCADPGAKASNLPIDGTDCDGESINTGPSLNIGTGGTVDERRYTINTLPTSLEPKDNIPVCNATHACVLYVGQNQNDFRAPHVWSAPFYVGTGIDAAGTSGVVTGSGSSAPLIIGIAVAAVVLLAGGYRWFRHRGRGRRSALA